MIRLLEEEQENLNENEISNSSTDTFLDKYSGEFYVEDEQLFDTGENNFKLIGVRCVAHTLQLAVQDAMETFESQDLLKKVCELVKKLRTSSIVIVLKSIKLRKPILDCATRWSSTINMLERLVELKDFCKEVLLQAPHF